MAKRWQCLDVGCGVVVSAGSDDELVGAVNAHVREAHGSYELEEMILDFFGQLALDLIGG